MVGGRNGRNDVIIVLVNVGYGSIYLSVGRGKWVKI